MCNTLSSLVRVKTPTTLPNRTLQGNHLQMNDEEIAAKGTITIMERHLMTVFHLPKSLPALQSDPVRHLAHDITIISWGWRFGYVDPLRWSDMLRKWPILKGDHTQVVNVVCPGFTGLNTIAAGFVKQNHFQTLYLPQGFTQSRTETFCVHEDGNWWVTTQHVYLRNNILWLYLLYNVEARIRANTQNV